MMRQRGYGHISSHSPGGIGGGETTAEATSLMTESGIALGGSSSSGSGSGLMMLGGGSMAGRAMSMDDADVAAGNNYCVGRGGGGGGERRQLLLYDPAPSSGISATTITPPCSGAPTSMNSVYSITASARHHPSDLEFFEDIVSDPVLVLGVDISHLSRQEQYWLFAGGNFIFSLTYGYLQELISVELANRKLGLFLAACQFSGYSLLAYILRNFVYSKQHKKQQQLLQQQQQQQMRHNASAPSTLSSVGALLPLHKSGSTSSLENGSSSGALGQQPSGGGSSGTTNGRGGGTGGGGLQPHHVPFIMYLGMSLLRAVDMAMTNLAMQYINYPAKTLMKSSKTVWTMLFGVVIARKVYKWTDYGIVLAMVLGLALFMHADANAAAVFGIQGVMMLTVSLVCDGAIANMSETIMSKYGVGQDEFIFCMYSIALVAITAAATVQGDMTVGLRWMCQPGTYSEMMDDVPMADRTWSVGAKWAVLCTFSAMGFFGSSCSAAITKNFGALAMSINATARKATTLFLSFFLFKHNVCTPEHVLGVVIFITALTAKSLRRRKGGGPCGRHKSRTKKRLSGGKKHHNHNSQRTSRSGNQSSPLYNNSKGSMNMAGLEIPSMVRATSSRDSGNGTTSRRAAVAHKSPAAPTILAGGTLPTPNTVHVV